MWKKLISKKSIIVFVLAFIVSFSMPLVIKLNIDAITNLLGFERWFLDAWMPLLWSTGFMLFVGFSFVYSFFMLADVKGTIRTFWHDRFGKVFFISTAAMVAFCLFFDALKYLFGLRFQYLMGTAISLWANICLYLLMLWVFRKCGVKYTKGQIIVTVAAAALVCSMLLYSTATRRFLYYHDYTQYYKSALEFSQCFDENNFLYGVLNVYASSFWNYSWFISLFSMFFLRFTDLSNNSFCASLSFSVLVPYIITVSAFALKMMNLLKLKGTRRTVALGVGLFAVSCQPQLYYTIYHSMPDMFGLVSIFMMMTLLSDYDFSKLDLPRLACIWLLTVYAVFTRRWYSFFVVSFWGVMGISHFVGSIYRKDWKRLRNLIVFAAFSIVFAAMCLYPMVLKVMSSNYIVDYSSWKYDTLPHNFLVYFQHAGYVTVAISFSSLMAFALRKSYGGGYSKQFALTLLLCFVLPLCLFHRIQTAEWHQLLILAPSMIAGTCLFPIFMLSANGVALRAIGIALPIVISLLNVSYAFKEDGDKPLAPFVSDASLLLPYRADYDMIHVVNDWILEHSEKFGDVYMVPHNGMYNPSLFRDFPLPDWRVHRLLPYGADVISAQPFPIELLTSKYVLTADPLGQQGRTLAPRINEVLKELLKQGYYVVDTVIDMTNGYNILAYKRVKPFDEHEREMYINAFTDLIEDWPQNYQDLLGYNR